MKFSWCLLALACVAVVSAKPGALTLAKDGKSDYRIVLPKAASGMEKLAASELQSFLEQISGAKLPIVTDDARAASKEILLGNNSRLASIGAGIDFEKLGPEGFTIRTVGQRLVIDGGPTRGALYGVYGLLEDHLGCRWFAPKVSFIPHKPTLVLDPIDDTQVPAMVYRDLYYGEARDRDFAARRRINYGTTDPRPGQIEGKEISGNGLCHTMFSFLPPEKYFATHPEYFALRDGKRMPTELCLSNPDVLRIVVEELSKMIAANLKPRYWSVSQMDNGEYCQCDQCKALDDREGAPSGSVLTFVNKVAAHFPDKTITTLAYWYTTQPPKHVKPAKNVHIVFCTDFDWRPPLREWYEDWTDIAPRWYTWSYVIPCHNIIAPWPNVLKLQDNVRDLIARGSTGMFVEGCGETGSEFAELRVYLLSKLMWNPRIDGDAAINEFLAGYYGAAGKPLRTYINQMYKAMVSAGDALSNHDWSNKHAGSCFTPAMFTQYDALFDEAEKAVAGQPDVLLRVQHARMPLMHAEVMLGYGSVDARIAQVKRLKDLAAKTNVPFFMDFGERPSQQYLDGVLAGLDKAK